MDRRSFQLAVLHIRARSPAISIFLVARENNPAFLLRRPETISIDPTSPFPIHSLHSIPFRTGAPCALGQIALRKIAP